MTLLPALAFGFALGVRHATDADHIAAVGTLVGGRAARRAALMGAAWGVGHSASILLVGGALVFLRLPMPVRVVLALEFSVGLMLIVLGVRSLIIRRLGESPSAFRPLFVGIVHGLAGSAVLALLLIGASGGSIGAAAYLVFFCVGTIAGMTFVTVIFALPARLSPTRAISLERGVRMAAGVASVGIGLAIAHRVGVRDGLFGAMPTLTP